MAYTLIPTNLIGKADKKDGDLAVNTNLNDQAPIAVQLICMGYTRGRYSD